MKTRSLPSLIGLALLICAGAVGASPIRITALDVQRPENLASEAVDLKRLSPDVILLQHAPGWNGCRELAQAMQPENYEVVVCSAFAGNGSRSTQGEFAILARGRGYLAWTEERGRFAFAAIRLAGKNVGLFSTDGGTNVALLSQIETLRGWKDNQPQVFVVAGDGALDGLRQAGFELSGDAAGLECVYAQGAGRIAPALESQTPAGAAVTFVFDPSAPPLMARAGARVAASRANGGPAWRWWLGGLLAAGVILGLFRRRRRANPPLQPVVFRMENRETPEGLIQWLKQAFVQRLVSDRARLIATQQAAELTVLAVDQRLTKIEKQIQRQHLEYERRIDELVKELEAAQEENRELIRAKIALVKAEMERARFQQY